MRQVLAACMAALTATAIFCAAASAAPTEVNVRIEGRSETLFEGTVAAEPHGVRASSDKLAAGKVRRCDGINVNDPQNTVPGVTPTAVSADAMSLIGETFDGRWFKQYEDYFVTRFGPDSEDLAAKQQWGILVNSTYTNVGGCQYQLDNGDEVLWVYDAFSNRPELALFPEAAHYTAGKRPLTLTVKPGEAVPLEVVSYADNLENNPPAGPTRAGSAAFAGARVSPVVTGATGFQRVESLLGTTSDANGKASVTYSAGEPGWHRVKATVGTPGSETAVRSNRIDICVEGAGGAPLEGATTCAETPAADKVRTAAPTGGEVEGPETTPTELQPPAGGGQSPAKPAPAPGTGGPTSTGTRSLRLSTPTVDRKQLAKGRLRVSWKVLDAGPGIRRWTISSQAVGKKKARWITRATGAKTTAATIVLPKGAAYKLRFVVTDASGRTSTVALGKVNVPRTKHHSRHR
jgi:hypothetical protein